LEQCTEESEAPALKYEFANYLRLVAGWRAVGLSIDGADIGLILALWTRAELRSSLQRVIGHHPCPEFLRPLTRHVRRTSTFWWVDWEAWIREYPSLAPEMGNLARDAAGRFNSLDLAVDGGITWARHFEGGEDAYRAIALALNRADRKAHAVMPTTAVVWSESERIRHDFEDHGVLSAVERIAVNRHLEGLGAELLRVVDRGRFDPVETENHRKRALLGEIAIASRVVAAASWGDEDEEFFATRLRSFGPDVSGFYRNRKGLKGILRRVSS